MASTIFSKVDYDLGSLVKFIELGEIALPDIQRPFVWSNAKVRNLFDSMYRGYPVGYFLFWQNALAEGVKAIGDEHKQKSARLLIVDGQQRLTSLYAVMNGVPVVRENYEAETIQIAFNPITEEFEVADAATKNNKQFIPNISVLWNDDTDMFEIVDNYLSNISTLRDIDDADKKRIRSAIQKVESLKSFPLTAIELSSQMDEEHVAEVFVRINSEGKKLNQADFILTLMSVFWEEGRKQLEDFCRESRKPSKSDSSPFNYFLQPDPDQLLRVAVGLAFKRARLKYVYAILRGKNLETDEVSAELRDAQFEKLKASQAHVLNLQYWHDYLNVLRTAGYTGERMISSQTAIIYSYMLYLIGRTEYNVDEFELRQAIAQWFFMATITGRYSSSPESKMEFDLAQLRDINNATQFCRQLRRVCNEVMTNDYWEITLPSDLSHAVAKSPTQQAFFAAQNLLDATALFSNRKISELLDPSTKAKRSMAEKHHLFPKNYLATTGISQRRKTNQIANYTLLEWGDNGKAADKAPAEYLPEFTDRFAPEVLERMYYWHALPDGWENMEYEAFLISRRERMANVIRDAYTQAFGDPESADTIIDIQQLVQVGESDEIEFKSTLRVNLHTGEKDPRMEHAVLKTIAGFLNKDGGRLVIGVSDDGEALGLGVDNFPNEDKMQLHLVNLINAKIGTQYMMYVAPHFEDYEGSRALVVVCQPARSPVYLSEGNQEKFYVRTGASTSELMGQSMQEYIRQRF